MDKVIKSETGIAACLTSDDICDLRRAIEFLKQHPGQVVETEFRECAAIPWILRKFLK